MKKHTLHTALPIAAIFLLTACSTTKNLPEGETLYTGVKKIEITSETNAKIPADIKDAIKSPLSVAPNNPLFSPYIRSPFPIGLWVYNYWKPKKEKGFKHWIYQKLGTEPVLISTVDPELRLGVVKNLLNGYGYFGTTTDYEILYSKRNPKKARIFYRVDLPQPYDICSVEYKMPDTPLGELIRKSKGETLLHPCAQYNADTLAMERERITERVRNEGYYFFRPDFIEYMADSTVQPHRIALQIRLKEGIPPNALRSYKVGRIQASFSSPSPVKSRSSMLYNGLHIDYENQLEIRPRVLSQAVRLTSGQPMKLKDQEETLANLNKLGIFRYTNLEVTPFDSIGEKNDLQIYINGEFDYPTEAFLETNASIKSNNFVGPGAAFGIKNNNLFGGGEVLSLRLKGSYEWQTGQNSSENSALLNSYEVGLSSTLSFPRLFVPNFILQGPTRFPAYTSFQLSATLMNRPSYFRILSFGGSIFYEFRTSQQSRHTLTLFKLMYNKLLNASKSFEQTMEENPAIALGFRNLFIPSMGYTYTYYKEFRKSYLYWQNSLTEAGNIISGIMSIFTSGKHKRLFGNEFAQFAKGTTEIKYYREIGRKQWLASRLLIGIGYPYGNSSVMPYSEQFYIGGANSIRAFSSRSLGPGSYRPPKGSVNGYFNQSGDFKLEANIEYRFPIWGNLHGALFLDAGNVWLLQPDKSRPGGSLNVHTFWKEIALGTGVGLRYDISFLILRADLGVGIHTPYPNPDKKGYYNISNFKDALGFHVAIGYPF